MTRLLDDFVPAAGLGEPHPQTLFGSVSRPKLSLPVSRQVVETPDGDFVELDVLAPSPGARRPTVVLLHGLEGSSTSGYILQMLAGCQARGWGAWAVNARSCGGRPNRQLATYSSGDFRDLAFLVSRLDGPVAVVGFSLGGSVVLNWLAKAPVGPVVAGVAVSAPYRLDECARYIDSSAPFARVYRRNFLPPMKEKALEKAARFPRRLDAEAIRRAQRIRDFDHCFTAPSFGFDSAEAYYQACSAAPLLERIATPTLLLSAADDPLAPAEHLPPEAAASEVLDVLVTARGGHVGFVTGSVLQPSFWAEARVLGWLDSRLST